jgi:nitroreductase
LKDYIFTLAKRRKTVRQNEVITALKAACQAPSGANVQPWRFIVITDPARKRSIRKACEDGERAFYATVSGEWRAWLLARGFNWSKPFLEEAPLLLLVFSQENAPYAIPSVWLAIGYLLLAIEERGLGTVTYTPSSTQGVLAEMDVPEGWRLEVILPIGFSAEEHVKEPRRSLDESLYINSWGHSLDVWK